MRLYTSAWSGMEGVNEQVLSVSLDDILSSWNFPPGQEPLHEKLEG